MLAITLVTLSGTASLAVDVGNVYYQWSKLRAATDAAALAGANYLPIGPTTAQTTARNYATSNGMAAGEVTSVAVAANNQTITVNSQRSVPAFLARAVGRTSFVINVSATAGPGGPVGNGVSGIIPVGLDYLTPYQYGQNIVMHNGGIGPGNWGGLALGGRGGNVFRDNLGNGYSGVLNVNDMLTTEPGAKVGPINQGISTRLSNGMSVDPGGTWSSHSLDDPRAAIVPLMDWTGAQGRSTVQLKGFAEVWITGNSGATINGVFIQQVINGTVAPGAVSAGAVHVSLLN